MPEALGLIASTTIIIKLIITVPGVKYNLHFRIPPHHLGND
jgi:hypothetical protein